MFFKPHCGLKNINYFVMAAPTNRHTLGSYTESLGSESFKGDGNTTVMGKSDKIHIMLPLQRVWGSAPQSI